MSEKREKDDSQPNAGLPRVQERRQVRQAESSGAGLGRAAGGDLATSISRLLLPTGGPHGAASGAAGQPEPGLVPPRRPSAAAARPGELAGLREPPRTGREPEGGEAERLPAWRGDRPHERCPRCSVGRERDGPRSPGVSPRLLLQAGGWQFTLSVTRSSAGGQRRQPQPSLLPHLR